MTMASAFLLAGSRLVVASYGEISEQTALAYARELYREPPPTDAAALSRWATRAVAALAAAASPPADWPRLRVLVP
jgi:hypothetical protein